MIRLWIEDFFLIAIFHLIFPFLLEDFGGLGAANSILKSFQLINLNIRLILFLDVLILLSVNQLQSISC